MRDVQPTRGDSVVCYTRALFPVLLVQASGPASDAGIAATNEWIRQELCEAQQARTKVAVILDISMRRGRPTPRQQRAIADWIKEHKSLVSETCVGWSHIIPSPILKSVITAIQWFVKFPAPLKLHPTVEDAVHWCADQLGAQNLPVPAGTIDGQTLQHLLANRTELYRSP